MELLLQAVSVCRRLQPPHQSYLASLLFSDIARLLDDGYLYVPNDPDLPDFAQRKLNPSRVKAITRYILDTHQDGTTFFPPICVNVQPPPRYKEGYISIPYHSASLRLTDGQHRCFGIRQALREIHNLKSQNVAILSQLEVGVLLYAGLSLEEERQAFRDQNLLVQRPSVSLAYTFDGRSPTVLVAKALLKQVPQFQNNVEMVEHGLGIHNPKLLTFSTLVTATHHIYPHLALEADLKPWINWAVTFWATIGTILPNDPWKIQNQQERYRQRQESLAVSGVVFQALGKFGHDLYLENVPADYLDQWLARLQEIDWRRENLFWQERGVTQIGAKGEPIISNTKTTVDACHRALREFVGIAPASGLI